jgi:hypothetical protein
MNFLVSFACNDDNGNLTGLVDNIDISEVDGGDIAMEIDAPMGDCDCENGGAGECSTIDMAVHREPDGWRVRLSTGEKHEAVELPMKTYGEYVGSIVFNAGEMEVKHVCELLGWMQRTGGWNCTTAWSELFYRFEKGMPIAPEHFGALPAAPEPCKFTVPLAI